jgi:proline iminopeptidase
MRSASLILALTAASLPALAADKYVIEEGYADSNGVLIYYKTLGAGAPLVILHGGPGQSHDYFLPYLLPLARRHRLIFIDERGSGRSEKLADPAGYTLDNMVEDLEALRTTLGLNKIDLLGHSFGGVLAQAYALKYQNNLNHLVLCSTFHSTSKMNAVLRKELDAAPRKTRSQILSLEKAGLYGKGKAYENGRYSADYMRLAWGEAYFPYLYQNHPDPNFDPAAMGNNAWDLYREMWGSHGEFIIDGNLKSVEYSDRLGTLRTPTLITVGDHDECDPALAREMNSLIHGSKLVVLPKSGHMTFVDQPDLFLKAVDDFLTAR